MKKVISIIVSLTLVFVCVNFNVYAVNNEKVGLFSIAEEAEEKVASIISLCVRFWNFIVGNDEADVPFSEEKSPSWKEYSDDNFVTEYEQTITAETWVTNEITFESKKSYADAFNDLDVDLLLYGNGRLYTVPGFWDGGNTWKVRFVCPVEGEWYYKTVCTDNENAELHNRTGKIICKEYDGEFDIYKHGFITIDNEKRYLVHDDSTPFFYLGDTHWSLGDETTDMVGTICDKRLSQGFTVFQSEPIGAKFDFTNGITEDDMAGLADFDAKFKIIAEHGFVHANAQFFFPTEMQTLIENNGGYSDTIIAEDKRDLADETKAYLEKISRYWVARYSAYPVIWTLGQEVDNDFYSSETSHPDWNYINNPYKLVATYIEKYDVYNHPLTAHQEGTPTTVAYGNGLNTNDQGKVFYKKSSASTFRDVTAHDFYAAQWPPAKDEQYNFDIPKDYWYNGQGKPVINYESYYCYLWTKNFGARMQGWLAYLNGMYGYGWGAHDTWSYLNTYNEDMDSYDGVDTITSQEKIDATWQDALEYESSYQVGYMKKFFETTEWYNLIPRFNNFAYFVPSIGSYYVYASNKENSEIVIYFYSFSDDSVAEEPNANCITGRNTGTVGNLKPNAKYIYQWFNPITGEFSEKQEFTATSVGTYFIGKKPTSTDMTIYIKEV